MKLYISYTLQDPPEGVAKAVKALVDAIMEWATNQGVTVEGGAWERDDDNGQED